MNNLELLIFIGGLLHFSLLAAGAVVPFVLDFRGELAKVDKMLRQLVWVYAFYIVMMLVAFGIVSVTFAATLAGGAPLARFVCGYIAIFWIVRLVIQLFVFDAKPHMTHWFFKLGYHALTVIFVYHAVVYSLAALTTLA